MVGKAIRNGLSPGPPPTSTVTVSPHTTAYPAVGAPLSSAAPPSLAPLQVTTSTAEEEQGSTAARFCACQTTGPHSKPHRIHAEPKDSTCNREEPSAADSVGSTNSTDLFAGVNRSPGDWSDSAPDT